MITTDGARSAARKWFARKQMAIIKDIDVPAKAVTLEGFLVKVWQQDDLSGGRITAPMGAVIMHSDYDGISVMVADNWVGGICTKAYLHTKIVNPAAGSLSLAFNDKTEAIHAQALPMPTASPAGVPPASYGTYDYYEDNYPTPVQMPINGEVYWIGSALNQYTDFDADDTNDVDKFCFEFLFNFCWGNGSGDTRTSLSLETGSGWQPWRVFQILPGMRIAHHHIQTYDGIDGQAYCSEVYTVTHQGAQYEKFFLSDLLGALPSGLASLLSQGKGIPAGNYLFANDANSDPVFLHAVDAYGHIFGGEVDLKNYFTANPGDEKWMLFYLIGDGTNVYTVDSSSFVGLLDSLADETIVNPDSSVNYYMAYEMLMQLLPRPNANWKCPFDSVMFHSHQGGIYTWTRKYGAVKFGTSGISTVSLYLPTDVSITGVRPDITHAGDGIYLCVCEKSGKDRVYIEGEESHDAADWIGVRSVHVGSPFSGWTALPAAPEGYRLRHVRPVKADSSTVELLGVIEKVEDATFHFAHHEYDQTTLAGQWVVMAQLPITDVKWNDNFGVGLFGVGSLADSMKNYHTPPTIFPQMPVIPYDKYAVGMP